METQYKPRVLLRRQPTTHERRCLESEEQVADTLRDGGREDITLINIAICFFLQISGIR